MRKKVLIFLIAFIVIIILAFIGFIIVDEYNFINLKNKYENIESGNAENQSIDNKNVENTTNNIQNGNIVDSENQTNFEAKETDFTLVDQYGNEQSLTNYRGKKVVIAFWAVWCPPCREEIPIINELSKEYEEAEFLTIVRPEKSSDERYSSYKDEINGYIEEHNITIPVFIDESEKLFEIYDIDVYPSIVVIDEEGNVREKFSTKKQSEDLQKQEIIEKLERY